MPAAPRPPGVLAFPRRIVREFPDCELHLVLIAAIDRFVAGYNERARPFVWTKTLQQVLAKAVKGQPRSETEH